MEPFGPFEVIRELDSANGATVYQAKKEGDQQGEYVVKVFSLERLSSEESHDTKVELDPLFRDIGGSFSMRVSLQKKAAESTPYFAPILAGGHDERGAWYVTRFYARSAKGMLDRFIALESEDLYHIVLSLVRAALHLKGAYGRPHGNLKPSNIFIDGAGKPRASRVLVSDPLPGGSEQAASFELADLRAIGELLYQLVMRRKVDFSSGWVILPVEASKEWTGLFGKHTPDWLSLCNKLLDSRLSLDQYDLSRLEADLLRIKPKRPMALVVAPFAAGALVVGGIAAYYVWHAGNYGKLVLSTDPPGAKVTITPINEYGNEDVDHKLTKTTPAKPAAQPSPLQLSLRKGDYKLSAEYEADNGTLKSRSVRVTVAARQTARTNLYLPYGTLVVLSEPPGASVTFGIRTATTPYTNSYVKPGEVSIRIELANYLPRLWSGKVVTNSIAFDSESLERIQAGRVNVAFSSDPPGASIQLDGGTNHSAPWITGLEDGRTYTVTAQLEGWQAQTQQVLFSLRDGVNRTNEFVFPYGILEVAETDPAGAQIWVDGKLADPAPLKKLLPLTEHEVQFKAEGYSNYLARVVFPGLRQTFSLTNIILQPLAGFVRLNINPPVPGVRVTERKTGRLLVETTAGNVQPVLALPPTNYDLVASYAELGTAQTLVSLRAGKTTNANFEFAYGAVVFTNVQPEEIRNTVEISGAGKSISVGEPIYLRPGNVVAYRARAPGYSEITLTNTVVAQLTNAISLSLSRVLVPLQLASQPPGATFYSSAGKALQPVGDHYLLPWGNTRLIARLGGLDPVTNDSVAIKWETTNVVPPFQFSQYAILVLTNLPDDVTLKEGARDLPTEPGAMRFAYDKPGPHTYDLYEGGIKVDTITTNLPDRLSVVLQSEVAGREFRNSLGLAFVKVPKLFLDGKDGWVGKREVSQAEYDRVMGQGADPSKYKGPDLPVENVNWLQAMEFCQKLTQMDTKHPPGGGGRYALPTLEQWKVFSAQADLKNAVYAAAEPAPVGSKGPSNKFGLNDVLGNVREWLDTGDAKNKDFIGGSFRSTPGFRGMAAFLNPEQLQLDTPSDDLGFRVIWVPSQ